VFKMMQDSMPLNMAMPEQKDPAMDATSDDVKLDDTETMELEQLQDFILAEMKAEVKAAQPSYSRVAYWYNTYLVPICNPEDLQKLFDDKREKQNELDAARRELDRLVEPSAGEVNPTELENLEQKVADAKEALEEATKEADEGKTKSTLCQEAKNFLFLSFLIDVSNVKVLNADLAKDSTKARKVFGRARELWFSMIRLQGVTNLRKGPLQKTLFRVLIRILKAGENDSGCWRSATNCPTTTWNKIVLPSVDEFKIMLTKGYTIRAFSLAVKAFAQTDRNDYVPGAFSDFVDIIVQYAAQNSAPSAGNKPFDIFTVVKKRFADGIPPNMKASAEIFTDPFKSATHLARGWVKQIDEGAPTVFFSSAKSDLLLNMALREDRAFGNQLLNQEFNKLQPLPKEFIYAPPPPKMPLNVLAEEPQAPEALKTRYVQVQQQFVQPSIVVPTQGREYVHHHLFHDQIQPSDELPPLAGGPPMAQAGHTKKPDAGWSAGYYASVFVGLMDMSGLTVMDRWKKVVEYKSKLEEDPVFLKDMKKILSLFWEKQQTLEGLQKICLLDDSNVGVTDIIKVFTKLLPTKELKDAATQVDTEELKGVLASWRASKDQPQPSLKEFVTILCQFVKNDPESCASELQKDNFWQHKDFEVPEDDDQSAIIMEVVGTQSS